MSSRYLMPTVNRVISDPVKRVKWTSSNLLSRWNQDHSQFPRPVTPIHCHCTMASSDENHFLTLENLNPCIKLMEYAVRGPLLIRATEIEQELKKGIEKPFNEVTKANIGDCHAMGQCPITFIRQVLAVVTYPPLLEDPKFPDDVKERAALLLSGCKGSSVGSYTDSAGIEIIRRHAAGYICQRDGHASNWENIVLCAGASDGIKAVLKLLIGKMDGKRSGIMVPIPQYPLYSATIAEFDMAQVGYYLNEDSEWALGVEELQRSIKEAKKRCKPRALVVINPGNPTGQVLTRKNIEEIIKFAYEEKLVIFADEVYQHNIYAPGSKFYSFKKVMMEMGLPYSKMELASFMSCSKGYMGECGLRGGYAEVVNFDNSVRAMYLKSISAMLCPTVLGQVALDCVVMPPSPGEPSFALYERERAAVLRSLADRAVMVADTFNKIEGISCNPVQGAMYAFPQLHLPPKAIEAAKRVGQHPDVYYSFQLLENTGICVVPGSGFGQKEGTFHFRTTILPQPEKLKEMLEKLESFHKEFMEKHQ